MIIPLIEPQFDKNMLVKISKEALDKSISGDNSLVLLSKAFIEEHCDDVKAIRDAGSLTRHLQYGFLIAEQQDIINSLLMDTPLYVNTYDTIKRNIVCAIISGNLQQWRDAIINCSRKNHPLTMLMSEFLIWFDENGYQHLFADYRRKKQVDGTFLLENKK